MMKMSKKMILTLSSLMIFVMALSVVGCSSKADKAAAAAIERREEAIRTLRSEEELLLEQIEELRRYRI